MLVVDMPLFYVAAASGPAGARGRAMCAIMVREAIKKTTQMQDSGKGRGRSAGVTTRARGRAGATSATSATGVAPLEPADQATAPPDTAAEVLKQFRIIFRSVKKHFQVIERKCGIGGSQLWALATIVDRPGLRVSELGQSLSIHQSTTSNLVEQMVRLGLIRRERDEEDQRVVRLSATPRGIALLARAPQPLIGLLPDALSHLDAQALEGLHASLGHLLSVMKARDESATHTPLADL